jgi:hypothetical protein
MSLTDEDFRAHLDECGLVRDPNAIAEPAPADHLLVFAQRTDARIELASIRAHAERFFRTTLGLTVAKRYETVFPPRDGAQFVIASPGRASGVRLALSRPTTSADVARAEAAERSSKMGGMGALAARCKHVWIIGTEHDNDAHALLLAAIMASVMLGPIVSGEAIFGVRGARSRLESYDAGLRQG